MSSGVVFDIEEFAIYDGPGIRKVVFLKGCPLSCNWCHNPEGISCKPELMVSRASCINCGNCTRVCKSRVCSLSENVADSLSGNEAISKSPMGACTLCGNCIKACPLRLRRISGTRREAGELAKELLSDKSFLAQNGGGITFSGGEPLMQSEFLFELSSLLKPLHLAIETCGHANSEIFSKAISTFDFILMDLKLTDPLKHKLYTGVDNAMILRNLEQLCSAATPFIIRIPLIPGVNDDEEHIHNVAELVHKAPALQHVELLPYQNTAGVKYAMLGRQYRPEFDVNEKPQQNTEILEKYNIRWVVL